MKKRKIIKRKNTLFYFNYFYIPDIIFLFHHNIKRKNKKYSLFVFIQLKERGLWNNKPPLFVPTFSFFFYWKNLEWKVSFTLDIHFLVDCTHCLNKKLIYHFHTVTVHSCNETRHLCCEIIFALVDGYTQKYFI